jgi:sulfite exporter TauE/SafE
MIEFWAAISIGLLGSLHCIGMCGPIAFALPIDRSSSINILSSNLIYNIGRLTTYFLIGAFLGGLGMSLSLFGIQQGLSIFIGSLMVLSVIIPLSKLNKNSLPFISKGLVTLKTLLAKSLGRKSKLNLFFIGVLNGLLPCGLVYMALAGSAAMVDPIKGGLFMMSFGLGTIPLMLSVGFYGNKIRLKFPVLRKATPVFIVLIGLFFIVRGLDFGIPHISPSLNPETEVINCH